MEKIDFVVIWVDGNDKEWQKEKAKYNPQKNADTTNNRYRDWNNLKYWFRAVEKFAPWVNKIHFVTNGQLPNWLNIDNEKLNFVKHSDYMDEEFLPTFSSHPIELNLHKIKGLAEKFVYFNDDTFLLKPVKETDFFVRGLPCDYATLFPFKAGTGITAIIFNNCAVINRHFNKRKVVKKNFFKWYNFKYGLRNINNLLLSRWDYFQGIHCFHVHQPFLKQDFEECWQAEKDALYDTSMRKFRSDMDVNQYVFRYWNLAKGRFHPKAPNAQYAGITNVKEVEILAKNIVRQKKKFLCINDCLDSDIGDKEFKKICNIINEAFEKILPQKSAFEK